MKSVNTTQYIEVCVHRYVCVNSPQGILEKLLFFGWKESEKCSEDCAIQVHFSSLDTLKRSSTIVVNFNLALEVLDFTF